MPVPIQYSGAAVDLSPRVFRTTTVAASPSAATETTIASITCTGDIAVIAGSLLAGSCGFTAGTSGATARVRIRRTDTSGTVVADSGAFTVAAASVYSAAVIGFDTAAVMPGQVYVLTLTVASAAAASTVSAAGLVALVV